MLLTYQTLTIRKALPEDAPLLCKWWNDGKVMAHAGFPNGLNIIPEELAPKLATVSGDTIHCLILEIDGLPVGEASYRNKGDGNAEIGIKICESAKQEKGYGSLFLKMLITGLFASGYEKIVLDTNVKNTRAQHVYEKLGFQKLRVNQDAWIDQLGEPQSSIDYELPKSAFTPLELSSIAFG